MSFFLSGRLRSKDKLRKTITRMIDLLWMTTDKLCSTPNNNPKFFHKFFDFAEHLVNISVNKASKSPDLTNNICDMLIFFAQKSLGDTEAHWDHEPDQPNSLLGKVFKRPKKSSDEALMELNETEKQLKRRIVFLDKKVASRRGPVSDSLQRQRQCVGSILQTIKGLREALAPTDAGNLNVIQEEIAKQSHLSGMLATKDDPKELEDLEKELGSLG